LAQATCKLKQKQPTRLVAAQIEAIEAERDSIHADAPSQLQAGGPARELYRGSNAEDAKRVLSAPDSDGNAYLCKSGRSRNRIAVRHCSGCSKVVRTMIRVEDKDEFTVVERGEHEDHEPTTSRYIKWTAAQKNALNAAVLDDTGATLDEVWGKLDRDLFKGVTKNHVQS
jgi:hypothetical protein